MNQPTSSSDIESLHKVLQMVYLAMGGGVLLFTVITLVLTAGGGPPVSEDHRAIIHTLSLAHLALGVVSLPLASRLHRLLLGAPPVRRQAGGPPPDRVAFAAKVQTATMFRAATLEAVALFGLVIVFLAGGIPFFTAYPVYGLNLASPVAFLAYITATFPQQDRLAALFREYGFT